MKFLMADSPITKNVNAVASALETHFLKLFNRNVPNNWMHVQNITRHDVLNEISSLMSMPELSESLFRLRWHKSPDKNGVSPNAVKVLEIEFKHKLLNFISLWLCDENMSYPSWLIGLMKALPKKGNLLDLSNWRGATSMGIASKVVSVFVSTRLQKLVKIRGFPCQFSATPKLRCQMQFLFSKLSSKRDEKRC